MKYQMKKIFVSVIILTVFSFIFSPLGTVSAAQTTTTSAEVENSITAAVDYLKAQQNDDGGIRWIDETSSVPASIRVILALAAAGLPQDTLISDQGKSPYDFLTDQGYNWVYQSDTDEPNFNLARAGQLLTAFAAANQDPYTFGSEAVNLVHLVKTQYDPNTGIFGSATPENVIDQIWAMLGLASAYTAIPQDAVVWLANAQLEDGSWNDGYGSYLDTTPLAVMALRASGFISENDPVIQLAMNFIAEAQNPNGGWQTEWDSTTNANTTGMMLQSIAAVGQNPSNAPWTREEGSPLDALQQLQQENGAIGGDFINAFGTADAILGLSNQPLYDLGNLRRVGRAYEFIFSSQGEDGGWGTAGQTLDVILAASAAGWDPASILHNDQSPLTYLADQIDAYTEDSPDAIGKTILALVASGQNPRDFDGVDLIAFLMETFDTENNAFGKPENTWHQAMPLLGLIAANGTIPEGTLQTLLSLQGEDGGWEYETGFGSWPDNTALALQALLASGMTPDEAAIQNGLNYLKSQQVESGGWGDASTTAFVIMVLNAINQQPTGWETSQGKNPLQDLLSYQNASGAFSFSADFPEDNLMATTAAVLAAMGGSYHLQPVEEMISNAAGLAIITDQGEITAACVPFEGESTSGLALIEASGIPYEAQDGFMNSILGTTNPQGDTLYWSYWHWDGREWVFNNTGAGESVVLPGAFEAWYFTSWEIFPSFPPDFVPNLSLVCGQNQLKNYTAQPYLNFYDLNQSSEVPGQFIIYVAENELQETDDVSSEELINVTQETAEISTEDTQDVIQETTEVTAEEESKGKDLPLTPIIIIGGVGLIVLSLILWLLLRKK